MNTLIHFLVTTGIVTAALLAGAGLLHLIPRLGQAAKNISEALCRAPGLDVVVTYFTVAPLIIAGIVVGWLGFAGAIAGQVLAVLIWTRLHELAHPQATKGPRIVKVLNRIVGPLRNHAALWLTATVTPMFWVVRMIQVVAYPPLRWLVRFPKYDEGQWVNVSRHKFRGLVGHDLIWCLYCDWMTGIWSLGTEMLRNVESFWCPIRFDHSKKCENCAIDFPDLEGGWVDANSDMAEVAQVLEKAHTGSTHAWFGHPVRITVRGKEPVLQPAGAQ